jgi:small subunit ribosomal protein S15
MAVTKEDKKALVAKFGGADKNTGSAPVQVAILTAEIENLKNHLNTHKKDNHSRRGILAMVAKRRKMLAYVKNTDPSKYTEIITELGLRK